MVDIQTVSIAIASASVVIGTVYYVFQVRHQTRLRETDLIMRIRSMWMDKVLQSWETLRKTEFKNFDYEKKCPMEACEVAVFFDNLGLLLHRGLIDVDLISELFLLEKPWQKMKPFVEGIRERSSDPRVYGNFECLYNEWKKKGQAGAKNG